MYRYKVNYAYGNTTPRKHAKRVTIGWVLDRQSTGHGSSPGQGMAAQWHWASCSHPCDTVTKQYNLIPVNACYRSTTGKTTTGLH